LAVVAEFGVRNLGAFFRMPSPCLVYGNLQSLSGGAIAQGTVIFELGNIGAGNPIGISGTSLFPNLKYTVQTAGDGSFNVNLWGNDSINPANTIYNVTYRDSFGNEVGPIQYLIQGVACDLNATIPVTSTVPPVLASYAPFGTKAFGNGLGGQLMLTTAKGTGGGPSNPSTIIGYTPVIVPGIVGTAWLPILQ